MEQLVPLLEFRILFSLIECYVNVARPSLRGEHFRMIIYIYMFGPSDNMFYLLHTDCGLQLYKDQTSLLLPMVPSGALRIYG